MNLVRIEAVGPKPTRLWIHQAIRFVAKAEIVAELMGEQLAARAIVSSARVPHQVDRVSGPEASRDLGYKALDSSKKS